MNGVQPSLPARPAASRDRAADPARRGGNPGGERRFVDLLL